MKFRALPAFVLPGVGLVLAAAHAATPGSPAGQKFTALPPAEEAKTLVLAPGYVAELIAAEPLVQEPVLAVWDGDGALFVAEMRSYMQDEAGTGTKTLRNGRIKRLTSSKGDGVMDRATIFVDGLNLPRMVLPLDDRIAVVETDSTSVWSYRDTDGDGVADEKKLLFKGKDGDGTKSVEHQDSGLDWNLDNWIYITYGRERYRYTDGTWRAEPMHGIWSQWGLTHDDTGRIFYSDNSLPASGFELPRQYWNLIRKSSGENPRVPHPVSLGLPWDMSFLEAKNLCPTDDRGGAAGPRKTFTSICGQSVFRGDALPAELRGNYFFCDPTIHVVRRAVLEQRGGRTHFTNPYGAEEFLGSSDIFFRPVNTASGPDGCLTVVDMYRGIIQDAPWLSEGPRKFIKESGLAAVSQHGRLWRIRHRDQPPAAAPKMLRAPTAELVAHLAHPNGWWRDTAQRLIILRTDREAVVPALREMARRHPEPLARLHAVWTLDGLGHSDAATLRALLADRDPRLRAAAAQISEPLLGDPALRDALHAAAAGETSATVAKQFILSLAAGSDASAVPVMDALIQRHLTDQGVFLAAAVAFWKKPSPLLARIQSGEALKGLGDEERVRATAMWTQGLAQWNRGLTLPKEMPAEQRKLITGGEHTYFETCVSCHGPDGKGVSIPGSEMAIAPALAGSARVRGPAAGLLPVLLNGLVGPIAGKPYQAGMMPPAAALGIVRDDRLAEVISFIRYAWGNDAASVTSEDVKQCRGQHRARTTPWTDDELKIHSAPKP